MAAKKRYVVEVATLQSQRAQRITRALRVHGWRKSAFGVAYDDEWRRQQAQIALDYARLIERDARAIRTHVESWAKSQGAA